MTLLGAVLIWYGYEYYLGQPQKIQKLKIGLAKQLISFAGLSESCQDYLKIVALCQSRLRNEEYALAFPSMKEKIATIADEAFFAGILKFDDDGCYKLEPLVEDFYYDLAFNSKDRKAICNVLKDFLHNQLEGAGRDEYLRLLPAAVHIFTLSGDISGAIRLRSEFTSTIEASMWDQYNHGDYDEAMTTAEGLLNIDFENSEALYVKALCLTRFDEYDRAEEILNQLLTDDPENIARYYYALGRIQERKENFEDAIELFNIGYVEQNIEDALSLLDTVSVKLRDRQWYAVKIQLLQKKRHEQECVQRMLLAREIQKEVTALQHEYEQKFGAYSTNEFILSPDT